MANATFGRGICVIFGLAAAIVVLLSVAGSAQAAPGCSVGEDKCPPLLGQFGSFGTGAGQLKNPVVAAEPSTGHIYVAEPASHRISEFDSNGNFVKAWGWGVRDGATEQQTCTLETGCRRGLEGAGAGQFLRPGSGVTVDEGGSIWILENPSRRAQKFSPTGQFLLMVGGEVDKTTDANVCTAASGDVCGEGVEGTGNGQFKRFGFGNAIDVGPGGTVYVGDENRIQKFSEAGTYEGSIPLAGAGVTESLTVAPDGSIYVISSEITEKVSIGIENGTDKLVPSTVVRKIGPSGEELARIKGQWEGRTIPTDPRALATDAEGNIFVSGKVVYSLPVEEGKPPVFEAVAEILAFDSAGSLISFEPGQAGFDAPSDESTLLSVATNIVGDGSGEPGEVLVGHFYDGTASGKPTLSYISAYGRPFAVEPKAPEIEAPYATSVATNEARVEALINPVFTTDTTYQVEYGTGTCSTGGCEALAPPAPVQLGGGAVNNPIPSGPVSLEGLQAAKTYHYRFVAQNEAGGPIHSAEATFRTFAVGESPAACPNAALRLGAATRLPDCRAYEMVSPIDKQGGQVHALGNIPGFPAGINQGAAGGAAITYSSYRAFANPKSAPYTSQYIARRNVGTGWSSEAISPPREGVLAPALDGQYKVFSADLSKSWLVSDSEPPLAAGALAGQRNLYQRDNQSGDYETKCPAEAVETPDEQYLLEPQGSSADVSHLVFWANDRLTPDAVPGKVPQVYECVNGELRLVSVLPGGEASPVGGSAGTDDGGLIGFGFRENNVAGAVSEDGSRIFWTARVGGPGPLYVRIGGQKTVQIAAAASRFRAASPDGSRVIYTSGEGMFEAAVGSEGATSSQIAGGVDGFMGASQDTRLVYFVSREDLDGAGPAKAGNHNLYLYRAEGGSYAFVGALSGEDAREIFTPEESAPVLTPIANAPHYRSSRVSGDGLHAAFNSNAPLTGYDNIDQASGEPDAEVYLYDADAEELVCASCNPSGPRPRGVNASTAETPFWAAMSIPGWENQLYASRVLAEDGKRLFFQGTDSLVPGDTNGTQDVYQWEAAGTGSCSEASATYSPTNGGCVDLISSGKSPEPSELVDASLGGADVFFRTASSLWPADPGAIDIYDARGGGGFPPPPPPPPVCEGGACQSPPPAPEAGKAGSAVFVGPGNVSEVPTKRKPKHCGRGAHKVKKNGKVRCVSNAKQRKSSNRRAAR